MSDLGTIAGATSLESAIGVVWANDAALVAQVPVLRLITGRVPQSELMPYVRMEQTGGSGNARTNKSYYQTARVVFHIWTEDYAGGSAVAQLILNAFANKGFDWTTGAVLDMRADGPPVNNQVHMPEIKLWETTVSFVLTTWQGRQD
ncbi:MAG: hypothetical protein WCJ35_18450 [Planctomycetota bacterium]